MAADAGRAGSWKTWPLLSPSRLAMGRDGRTFSTEREGGTRKRDEEENIIRNPDPGSSTKPGSVTSTEDLASTGRVELMSTSTRTAYRREQRYRGCQSHARRCTVCRKDKANSRTK